MNKFDLAIQILNGVIAANDALAEALVFRAKLEALRAEGRDPTDAEFAALFEKIADDTAAIHDAARTR